MAINLPDLNSPSYPRDAVERLAYVHFDSQEEAADYVKGQIDRAQIILRDTVDQARERGLTDDQITDFIKEGILSGVLPRLAEQADPPDKNHRLILIIDKLPPEIKEQIEVKLDDDQVQVLAPMPGDQYTNTQLGWIAAIDKYRQSDNPETFADGLSNHPKQWAHLVKEIVQAVESRPEEPLD